MLSLAPRTSNLVPRASCLRLLAIAGLHMRIPVDTGMRSALPAFSIRSSRVSSFFTPFDLATARWSASLARNPNNPSAHRLLAATYAETGRLAEAQAEVAEVLRLTPNVSLALLRERWPFRDPAVQERYLAALAKAGYPP